MSGEHVVLGRIVKPMRGGGAVRKVVAYELLSLDGVAEEPRNYITDFDAAMEANFDCQRRWDDAIPDLVRCPRDGPHPR
jgi:hypothetical protein